MYIPGWILAGIVIAVFIYLNSKQKKPVTAFDTASGSEKMSYRLSIWMEPNWYEIFMKIYKPKDEKEKEKLEKRLEKIKKDPDSDIWGRRYSFVEYYDAATGLTMHYQTTHYKDGRRQSAFVDEFKDRGAIFESESKWEIGGGDEKRKESERISVEISENYIRNNIYDQYIGGSKSDFDYTEDDYLFYFPLHDVFNFLHALGTRFHEAEENTIIKWPDGIQKKFDENGIKYETYFEFEPKVFDVEKHDKEFYEKMGKPKIALGKSDRFHSSFLQSKEAFYSVSLKMFRPDENDRISARYTGVIPDDTEK